jgi:CheY-like chemotaxis protein
MSSNEAVNILLVDDLSENILVLQSVLSDLGENLITANSGSEALKLVLEHEFAVILLDVNMPGIDGMEAAELIRKRKRSAHTPIIFMTAYADELHTARGYALGAVDCILSPVIPEVLRTKVKVFVDLFRMSQAIQRQADERVALAEEQARRVVAEENSRQYTFLANAGRTLTSTLDYDATCQALANIIVPALGDWIAVTPDREHGGILASVIYRLGTADAEETAQISSIESNQFENWNEIVATIQSVLESGHELSCCHVLENTSVRFCFLMPLRVQGKYLGVLTVGRHLNRNDFSTSDLHLVREIAGRAAMALDNARLYSALQRADRDKNEFLSMLAHELRNPLASICNAVQLLQMPGYQGQDIEWVRDVVSRQMVQLVRMVDDLLDVSRITQGKIQMQMSLIHPEEFVRRAVETSQPLIDSRHHNLEIEVSQNCSWVQGDTVRLTQIVANLLNNAAKYTPEGGVIQLLVECEHDTVSIRVRDNGIGIPPNMLFRIFELFTQDTRALDRAQGGLGIGLTLVKRLTEMHGGTVQAYSNGEKQGSEFIVTLPAARETEPKTHWAPEPAHPAVAPGSKTILIVDDNVDAAIGLSRLLRTYNYDVIVAHDGHSALNAYSESNPDAVLLDIGLPGMDGYEIARHIRQMTAGTPLLIAITGYGQEEDHKRSMEAGFNHHLVKPVRLEEIISALETLNQDMLDSYSPTVLTTDT